MDVHIYMNMYLYLHMQMHKKRAGKIHDKVLIAVSSLQRNRIRWEGNEEALYMLPYKTQS